MNELEEMYDAEERAERQKHDDKVRELEAQIEEIKEKWN